MKDEEEQAKLTGQAFLRALSDLSPSRQASLAKTKTEEALYWLSEHIKR